MYNDKTIAAVVPAYNEEPFIGEVIETLPEFIDRAYVIDDRSTDDTWSEIRRKAEAVNEAGETTLDRVVPICHAENKGVGGAIKTGYLQALEDEMDVTTVIAGDGQTEPDIVERIVAPVADGRADYSKGNRLLGQERRDMPLFRQVGNFTLTLITKIASGYWKIMDPQNGSTAISHEALDRVGIEEMYEGYGYCNDLLVRLNANNVRIADVKRRAVYKDEESDIDYKTYIPRVSGLLLRGFLWRLRVKYLVRDFHPLALFYYVGAATAGAGLLSGLKGAVDRDSPSRGSPLVLFALGWLFLLLAMAFDLNENEDLELLLYDDYE
jgi:glycosyltransferase involved in cell wall biosynthesis